MAAQIDGNSAFLTLYGLSEARSFEDLVETMDNQVHPRSTAEHCPDNQMSVTIHAAERACGAALSDPCLSMAQECNNGILLHKFITIAIS